MTLQVKPNNNCVLYTQKLVRFINDIVNLSLFGIVMYICYITSYTMTKELCNFCNVRPVNFVQYLACLIPVIWIYAIGKRMF